MGGGGGMMSGLMGSMATGKASNAIFGCVSVFGQTCLEKSNLSSMYVLRFLESEV